MKTVCDTWCVFKEKDLDYFNFDNETFPELRVIDDKKQLKKILKQKSEHWARFSFFRNNKLIFILLLVGIEKDEKVIALIPSGDLVYNLRWVKKELLLFTGGFLKKTSCHTLYAFSEGYKVYERWLLFLGFKKEKTQRWIRRI